jgi:hypothetical protein
MENITPAPNAMSPRSILLRWIDEAFRLEEENRELCALMTNLVIAVARHRQFAEMARVEIEERFPVEVAA